MFYTILFLKIFLKSSGKRKSGKVFEYFLMKADLFMQDLLRFTKLSFLSFV